MNARTVRLINRTLWLVLLALLIVGSVSAEDSLAYDITDEDVVWAALTADIVVLDVASNEKVYLLDAPNGERITDEKLAGFINGASAAVEVLGEDEDGWTLIAGRDMWDRPIQGYVKTSLLKTVTPNQHMGVVVDKLTQRMYIFQDGKLLSELLVSTGLPSDKQPYNETASGEYLFISWVGGFWSDSMWCDMGIRFNGGDLIHLVPARVNRDGSYNYEPYEPKLGSKASHGCIRVQRLKNAEGINMRWLWENLRRGTKIIIWDDDGRTLPYPDDELPLYYNPKGGQYYHLDEYCASVRDKYLPLTGFTYGELDVSDYIKLTPCPSCAPPLRKEIIDEQNTIRLAVKEE